MSDKLSKTYYSPQGYWRGIATIKKLANKAKISDEIAYTWLKRQAVWQMYLPAPLYILRPMCNKVQPKTVHQAELLYLQHDKVGRKT